MTEKQLDTKETPIEELQCHKKYVYDTGIIFECKNNCKSEIIGEDVVDLLNELATKCSQLKKENEQLKQRNNRQAKQLDRLYHLIEEKDWRTLSDIIDDFKRCEEQLQREWKCYE